MYTSKLDLNVREALASSLSFAGQFLKQYWLLALIYILIGVLPAFIIGDQDVTDLSLDKRAQFGIVTVANIFPGLLMIYYALKEALLKIDPSIQLANKSLAKVLWQIVCINIISAIVGVPLFILFVVPGIWWSTKASVSYAHLLSSNDGTITSIQKSHQLMDGKFWRCFGFLLATSTIVILGITIAGAAIGFFLLIGGMFNALFHEGAGLNKMMLVFRLMGPIFAVLSSVIFYYIQAWLYIYLRSQENTAPTA